MKERAIGHGQRELYGNTDEIGVAYVGEDDVLLVSDNIEQGRGTGVGNLGLKYAASKYIDVTAGIRVERGKNYQDCCGRVGMKYKFGKRRGSGRDLKLAKKRIHRYATERLESSKEKLMDMKMKLQARSAN